MKVLKTIWSACTLFEPTVFDDNRGFFYEGFNEEKYLTADDNKISIKQLNFSQSEYGVVRGLHYQKAPMDQGKLVSVLSGKVWDVAVDIRKDAPTYGQWHGEILSAENKRRFFIPRGFAHGFVALSSSVELMYAVDNVYSPEHDAGIIYNDPQLKIDWKIPDEDIILSDKDRLLPTLEQAQ